MGGGNQALFAGYGFAFNSFAKCAAPAAAIAVAVATFSGGFLNSLYSFPVMASPTQYVTAVGASEKPRSFSARRFKQGSRRSAIAHRKYAMKSKSIASETERTFVLILDQGEEAFKTITDFANQQRISGASVSAVGAFAEAKVGWFDLSAKTYKPISVGEQCEVLSLIGDVAEGDDGKASLHLHAVLGLQDGSVRGGHLLSGSVRPTLEVTIRETVAHLRRERRSDLGIALISI
jgi:hypothetical protein